MHFFKQMYPLKCCLNKRIFVFKIVVIYVSKNLNALLDYITIEYFE